MGIQEKHPDYLRAKHAFIRDLIQFHESRGTGQKCDPKINGKEVDLYLLYQIVTSHGGWEKVNLRNEWDKLLEHFHFPHSTNGGLAIKQIYLRYLELYEKIHYLGEDVDTKEEHDDDYEDFRGRRRYPNKLSSSHHHSSHHASSSHHQHHPPKEITDQNRSQLGLSSRILKTSDYEGLLLSLQSPLPNEQDMAISVCTLLSNETKHVLRFSKSPAILNMLLAHAGIYQDCGMRLLMEETYKVARDMDYAEFWDEVLHQPDARQLLCECFVKRVHTGLGLTDDEGAILSQLQEIDDGDLPEEEKYAMGTALRLKLSRLRELREFECPEDEGTSPNDSVSEEKPEAPDADNANPLQEPKSVEKEESADAEEPKTASDSASNEMDITSEEVDANPNKNDIDISTPAEKAEVKVEEEEECCIVEEPPQPPPLMKIEPPPSICCRICPCERLHLFSDSESDSSGNPGEFSIESLNASRNRRVMIDEAEDGPLNSLPFTLTRSHHAGDKVGQRICQIAHILRNLSFEQDNASVMAKNPTLMRFVLVAANCTFGSLAQDSFDIIGNISSFIHLEEPLRDPLSSMLLTLITSGVFSTDRFKILRSLESIRELSKVEGNEGILGRYVENRVYRRMCDILTLSDIMLLIYTLECILSMTGLGEAVCDEIVRVQGSVATLVSLVTVEAQSYGPKGCILMRVVETVTGASTSPAPAATSASSAAAAVTGQPLTPQQQLQQTVSSTSPAPQQLLQQQLQQPPNPIYAPPQASPMVTGTPSRPSPATSPSLKIVSGTTTVVPPVVQGQPALQSIPQLHQQLGKVPQGISPHHPIVSSSQVFNNSTSNLINHLNSPTPVALSTIHSQQQYLPAHTPPSMAPVLPAGCAGAPKPSALPSNILAGPHIKQSTATNGALVNYPVPSVPPPPPPGATVVIRAAKVGGGAHVATVQPVNGAPTRVTGNLPQIANHNLNQHHVVTPTISLVTPRGTLSEEAWAIAWLKGTFESSTGTSIEQGEIYRMYSAARKNPNVVLSLEQFVKCVQCAYSTSVGPVIKKFGGGTSLSFFEGIKPKIAIRAVAVASSHAPLSSTTTLKPGGNPMVASIPTTTSNTNPPLAQVQMAPPSGAPAVLPTATTVIIHQPQQPSTISQPLSIAAPPPVATIPQQQSATVLAGSSNPPIDNTPLKSAGVGISNNSANISTTSGASAGATLPVSVHIPSREARPSLSPILQATLSQPPKAKSNNTTNSSNATTPSKRSKKSQKRKESKQPGKQVKVKGPSLAVTTTSSSVLCQTFAASSSGPITTSALSKGKSTLSPASSAIRSLLASKVAQRQQNKLQQQVPGKTPLGKPTRLSDKLNAAANNMDDTIIAYPSSEIVKVNGIGPEEKRDESSASSSVVSNDSTDGTVPSKPAVPITSFHGNLHNGQASLDLKSELNLEGIDDPESFSKNRGSMKGMLIDLLERRVPAREPVNGIMTGREIRISEKGLELIDKMEETMGGAAAVVNHHESSGTCAPTEEGQESQKMTFYSSTSDAQVTLQGQAPSTACVIPASAMGTVLSSSVTLASGGGGGSGNGGVPPSNNTTLTLRTPSGGMLTGQQVKLCGGKFVRLIEAAGGGIIATPIAASALVTPPPAITEVEATTEIATPLPSAAAFSLGETSVCVTAPEQSASIVAPNGDLAYVLGDPTGQHGVFVDFVESVITNSADELATASNNNVGGGGEIMIVDGDGSTTCNNNNNNDDVSSNAVESNCNNGVGNASLDDGDLLEQFSQFSDLIVVPPEQLASLKRPSSPLPIGAAPGNNNNSTGDDCPTPAKKQALEGGVCASGDGVKVEIPVSNNNTAPSLPEGAVHVITSTASIQQTPVVTAVATTAAATPTTGNPGIPPGTGAQVVQLPLRLSVNPQNPQQLTFTRQLMLPTGQQLLLSTGGNSQSAIQGQVIISKPQGNTTDPMPKAIIILQQPQQQTPGAGPTVANAQNCGTLLPPPQPSGIRGNPAFPPVSVQQAIAVNLPTATAASGQQTKSAVPAVPPAMTPNQQVVASTLPSVISSVGAPSVKQQIVTVQQHPHIPVQSQNARLSVPGVQGAVVTSAQQLSQLPSCNPSSQQQAVLRQVVANQMHPAALQQPQQQQQQQGILHQTMPQHPHHLHLHQSLPQHHVMHPQIPKHVSIGHFEGIRASSYPQLTQDQLDLEFPFLCEWTGCGLRFLRPAQVIMHALKIHCPETMVDAVRCEWGSAGCDPLLRKRFSLMTHLQDRHCSKQALELALYRRKNKIEPPPVPQQPIHHPGYAPNAALHAIKRHAMSFMNTKEHLHDDNEGPVTKSIRLTSALILRNLVNYSGFGRRMLQGYESHLSAIAMSNVESSRTIAQLLHDMNEQPKSSK